MDLCEIAHSLTNLSSGSNPRVVRRVLPVAPLCHSVKRTTVFPIISIGSPVINVCKAAGLHPTVSHQWFHDGT